MNLQNHFLIAMPSLNDPMFERSVVYICEHHDDGAMGLVINRPIPELSVNTLLSKLNINHPSGQNPSAQITLESPVFFGGPLADDRGFILHSPQKGFSSSIQVPEGAMVTTSKDILSVLGTDTQPEEVLVTLGYSSWSRGQIEQELIDNAWLVVEADSDILFHIPPEQRWQAASQKLGIDIYAIAHQVGHA